MHRTRIKFCGICRVEDAVAASEAGVDAIGMVFHAPATRGISQERAKSILAALPPFVTPVALFVDAQINEMLRITDNLGIGTVQLHGNEGPEVIAALADHRRLVIKAIRCDATLAEQLRGPWPTRLGGLVLESPVANGGSGVANDWELVKRCITAESFAKLPPIIAAGGLTPDTVGEVVRTIRPFAVDVSSGIESSKGVKSVEKMRQFVNEVRKADFATPASVP